MEDSVMRYRPGIRAKARQSLWMPDLAEDACQETLFRVLRHFRAGKQFESPAVLTRFVLTTCRNVVLEMNRQVQPQIPEAWEAFDQSPSPHEVAVTEERKRLVHEILKRLRPRDRNLLIAVLQERDKDQLCRQFGVDRDYLRVLLFHARQRFRREVEKMEGTDDDGPAN